MAQDKAQAETGRGLSIAPLTDRVNSEPPVVNGMSASEANYIGLISLAASLVMGVLIYAFTSYWIASFLICLLVPFMSLWYGSLYLQTVKRNRPEGYYLHAIHLALVARNILKSRFINHNGYFELGCRTETKSPKP